MSKAFVISLNDVPQYVILDDEKTARKTLSRLKY
jgi:hypothetical protein